MTTPAQRAAVVKKNIIDNNTLQDCPVLVYDLKSSNLLHEGSLPSDKLCDTKKYWTRPRAAMKNSGKIIFILNINGTETRHRHKKSHRQEYVPEVDVEECVSTGNPCGDGSIWSNLDTFCKPHSAVVVVSSCQRAKKIRSFFQIVETFKTVSYFFAKT